MAVENTLDWPIGRLKDPDLKGTLTVSGRASVQIPCTERPLLAFAWFSDKAPPKVGCGPMRPDELDIALVKLRSWVINISWNIHSGGSRTISWEASLAKGWWRKLLELIGWF